MATSWGFCTPLELRKLKFVGKRRGGVGKVVDNRAESSDLLFTVCIHRCHDGQDNNSEFARCCVCERKRKYINEFILYERTLTFC